MPAASSLKLVIYRAFVENKLDVPRHLARDVHKNYFEPTHPDFAPRTMWSLSNAFTSALKSLEVALDSVYESLAATRTRAGS
jgi:hypothetical protein